MIPLLELEQVVQKYLSTSRCLVWTKKSNYGNIYCCRSQNEEVGVVVKDIIPWHFAKLVSGWESLADFLNQSTLHFRRMLREKEVPLADMYDCEYVEKHLFHISQECGVSVDTVLRDGPAGTEKIIGMIIRAIKNLIETTGIPDVGLDPQLANFTELNGKIFYIDVFPALCVFRGERLVHYPNPQSPVQIEQEIERKFMPLGILRRLRFSIMSVAVELETVFMRQLVEFKSEISLEAINFFRSLPDKAITIGNGLKEIRQTIESVPPVTGVDTIREIALRIAQRLPQTERSRFLTDAFCLSSMHLAPGYTGTHEERFARLKNKLVETVQS